jgi:WD40 repeat protein
MAVWDVRNGRRLRRLGEPPSDSVDAEVLYAFSADAARLVVLTGDGIGSIYELSSNGEEDGPRKLPVPGKGLSALALDRDGSIMFLGHDDGQVIAWNWSTGTTEPVLTAAGRIHRLATDASGGVLAIVIPAEPALGIQFWDLRARRRLSQLSPLGSVYSIAFTPDAQRVALAVFKQGIVVVDVASGRPVGQSIGLIDSSDGDTVVFDGDGRLVAVDGGTAVMFDPLSVLCDVLNGDIGEARWADIVGTDFDYRPVCGHERGLR